MRIDRASWLLWGLLFAGCAAERSAGRPESDPLAVPVNPISEAPAKRAMEARARRLGDPLGSYWRRVWEQEFERLLAPARASPAGASLPPVLTGPTVASWERRLNDAWQTSDPDPVIAATEAVIAEVAPLRDQLAVWAQTQQATPEARAAVGQLDAILLELVQEAELLALRDSGQLTRFEAFVARYPDGPYTASVLFALGALHETRRDLPEAKDAFQRVLARFPTHPVAGQAREKLQGL